MPLRAFWSEARRASTFVRRSAKGPRMSWQALFQKVRKGLLMTCFQYRPERTNIFAAWVIVDLKKQISLIIWKKWTKINRWSFRDSMLSYWVLYYKLILWFIKLILQVYVIRYSGRRGMKMGHQLPYRWADNGNCSTHRAHMTYGLALSWIHIALWSMVIGIKYDIALL